MADSSDDEARQALDLNRRELIKLGAAATVAATLGLGADESQAGPSGQAPLPGATAASGQAAGAHAFFRPEEFAIVDELSELIIPADAHSPGARAAKVADYIDARLAEAFDEQDRAAWRAGLRRVEELSREMARKPFMQATESERAAILTRMAQNERQPRKPEERFFVDLKARVAHAYYSSEIGIKQDLEYKGNTYLAEFVGYDVS